MGLVKRIKALELAKKQAECNHSFIASIKIKHWTISRVCYKCDKRVERTITQEGDLENVFSLMAKFIETGKEPTETATYNAEVNEFNKAFDEK
jgi:transcription elongation factor Elf1